MAENTQIEAEINKIETRKTIQRINETKIWFFKKINNIDKPLSKLTKRQRNNIQINKIRNEKRDIQQTRRKYRESSGHVLKTCTSQNWIT